MTGQDGEPERAPVELVVTLRPSAFAAGASRLGDPLEWLDEPSRRTFEDRRQAEAAIQPPVPDGDTGFDVLRSLERDGMLLETQPLARGIGGEAEFSSTVPMGKGRATIASVESFRLRGGRPSDQILSGSLLLTLADEAAMAAAINRLSDAPRTVERVERVPLRRQVPHAAGVTGAAWHIARIRADRVRQQPGYDDGSQVSVAVVDSGVDAGHPMLASAIADYTSSYPGGEPADPRDLLSHGTVVAGVIGSRGEVDGVCRSRLRVLKVFRDKVDRYQSLRRPDGRWFYQAQSAPAEWMYMRALAECLDEDVPVINFSLGYENPPSKEAEIFAGYARGGQAVIAATGNMGAGSPRFFPAAYPGAIAVGALDQHDRAASISSSSPDMRISAPGVDIVGTMPTYDGAVEFEASIVNDVLVQGAPIPWSRRIGSMTGTSAAAPQVAAAAALWIARNGRDLPRMRERLAATARKLPEMNGAARTDRHGYGCLDLLALLA